MLCINSLKVLFIGFFSFASIKADSTEGQGKKVLVCKLSLTGPAKRRGDLRPLKLDLLRVNEGDSSLDGALDLSKFIEYGYSKGFGMKFKYFIKYILPSLALAATAPGFLAFGMLPESSRLKDVLLAFSGLGMLALFLWLYINEVVTYSERFRSWDPAVFCVNEMLDPCAPDSVTIKIDWIDETRFIKSVKDLKENNKWLKVAVE